jgi:hypothetical protein
MTKHESPSDINLTRFNLAYAKSELGANRGSRAGSPRGVVVATSQKCN